MFIEVEEGRVMVVFNLLNENVASDEIGRASCRERV